MLIKRNRLLNANRNNGFCNLCGHTQSLGLSHLLLFHKSGEKTAFLDKSFSSKELGISKKHLESHVLLL
jgi:hypothetical protein